MGMVTKTVEMPDGKSWVKIIVASILLHPIVLALFILATSAENMLDPVGIFSTWAVSYALVGCAFRKWRPKFLS